MQTRNGKSPLKGRITEKSDQIRIKKNKKDRKKKEPEKNSGKKLWNTEKKSENIVFVKQ